MILREHPEVRTLIKLLKEQTTDINDNLIKALYNILIEYASPNRVLRFMRHSFNNTLAFCSECGIPHISSSMRVVWSQDRVCTQCFSDFYVEIDGHVIHTLDNSEMNNGNNLSLRGISNLNSYDAPVDSARYGLTRSEQEEKIITRQGYDNLPYLGVELEVEARQNCPTHEIVDLVKESIDGPVMCKSDGSLHRGMEIVSGPRTLAKHKDGYWEKFFQENGGPAKYLRAWRTDTCGTHIHISRVSFTPIQMARFIVFINSLKNTVFIETFAGRDAERWAKRSPKKPTDILIQNERKYEAINFAHTAPTIEVRIFRGNISKHGVYRNLEFIHALWSFTKDASLNDLSYQSFINWLKQPCNKASYPYLFNWCVQHDYIRAPLIKSISDKIKGD